jgi:prevent-host-death family protein
VAEIVNMHQAKTSLSRLVERALAGEEVVIARNGEPLVKLVPIDKAPERRIPGRYKGKIWMSPDFEFTEQEIEELFEGSDC